MTNRRPAVQHRWFSNYFERCIIQTLILYPAFIETIIYQSPATYNVLVCSILRRIYLSSFIYHLFWLLTGRVPMRGCRDEYLSLRCFINLISITIRLTTIAIQREQFIQGKHEDWYSIFLANFQAPYSFRNRCWKNLNRQHAIIPYMLPKNDATPLLFFFGDIILYRASWLVLCRDFKGVWANYGAD